MNLHLIWCQNITGRTNITKNAAAQCTVSLTELILKAAERKKMCFGEKVISRVTIKMKFIASA